MLLIHKKIHPKIKKESIVFILCWIAYASIYFGRINLSVAASDIQSFLGINKAQIGLLGTVFFWIYATGQLINGNLGDRFAGYKMIFLGLLVTGTSNILFGSSSGFIPLLVIWTVNGYAQSMLWGPMVRTLSDWYPENMKSKISVGISTSMTVGYLLAWGLSGRLTATAGWRPAFIVPGIFIFLYSFIWLLKTRKLHTAKIINVNESSDNPSFQNSYNKITMIDLLIGKRLWLIACVCMTQGIIKESISMWGPIFIMERNNIDISALPSIIIIIPLINFLGLLLAGHINKLLHNKEKITILIMYLICTLMIVILAIAKNMTLLLSVIITGGISASMFGANSMLLGVIPMNYTKYHRSSSAAGFLDFCSYVAAGVSSTVVGLLASSTGWSTVINFWLVTVIIGILLTAFSYKYTKS